MGFNRPGRSRGEASRKASAVTPIEDGPHRLTTATGSKPLFCGPLAHHTNQVLQGGDVLVRVARLFQPAHTALDLLMASSPVSGVGVCFSRLRACHLSRGFGPRRSLRSVIPHCGRFLIPAIAGLLTGNGP